MDDSKTEASESDEPSFWDRMTPGAQRAIDYAHFLAEDAGADEVGTQHLLASLLLRQDAPVVWFFHRLALPPAMLLQEIEAFANENSTGAEETVLARDTEFAIQCAVLEADRMQNVQVGTEHLLLGLMLTWEGVAHSILAGHYLTLAHFRALANQWAGKDLLIPVVYSGPPADQLLRAAEAGEATPKAELLRADPN